MTESTRFPEPDTETPLPGMPPRAAQEAAAEVTLAGLPALWRAESAATWDLTRRPDAFDISSHATAATLVACAEQLEDALAASETVPEEPEPEPALPEGIYGRVEFPGMRGDTGWVTEGTRGGQSVLVVSDWNGCPLGEYILGPACRLVHLATPLKRPEPQRALPRGSGMRDCGCDEWTCCPECAP